MRSTALARRLVAACLLALWLLATASPRAHAIPSFISNDNRLPNPDRPYEMVGPTVHFDSSPHFAIYDLEFSPSNPAELDTPSPKTNGNLEFDSTFHVNYKAVISFSTQPPRTVTGIGTARARGIAIANSDPTDFVYFQPEVYDTELVELNLFALSPIPEVMFRESPTLPSSGRTIRENACPVCAVALPFWRISSYFDANTEVTFNGGVTWTPARTAIHIEQAPDGFPPGDYNHDKAVDASDYIVWRQTVGHAGAGLDADGDWSGVVDEGDFNVWGSHFGDKTATTASGAAAVPEPSTITPYILGTLAVLIARRQARVPRRTAIAFAASHSIA